MKKSLFIALLAIIVGSFSSCQKDNTPQEQQIKEQIIGKWRTTFLDGAEMLTDNACVETYNSDGTMTVTTSSLEKDIWYDHQERSYSLSGNTITSPGFDDDNTKCLAVTYIDGENLEGDSSVTDEDGKVVMANRLSYTRVNVDYSTDILGTWEGVEMTGEETAGDANHRWKYKKDGTYVYYNKVGGFWVPEIGVDTYCVDGDLLVQRWKEILESEFNSECWTITSCTDSVMTWSALREKADGSRFTTTFKMKKVSKLVK